MKKSEKILNFPRYSLGAEKNLLIGFPVTPLTVTQQVKGSPGLQRTEKVAPVSRRKSMVFPSTSRITQGSRVPIDSLVEGAIVRSPGPHQFRGDGGPLSDGTGPWESPLESPFAAWVLRAVPFPVSGLPAAVTVKSWPLGVLRHCCS